MLAVEHHRRFGIGTVGDLGHVGEVDGLLVAHADHEAVQLPGLQDEPGGFEAGAAVVVHQGPGGQLGFGALEGRLQFGQGHAR